MGKGKKRNRRRSQAAKLAAKFTSHTHHQILEDAIRYEHAKAGQLEYVKVVANLEKSMLSRTLFVTYVRDLKEPRNIKLLRLFFKKFRIYDTQKSYQFNKRMYKYLKTFYFKN